MQATTHPALAVFASDKGPGDPERSSIMSQAGTYLARKGARIVCVAEVGAIPVPLVTSARAAGGEVTVLALEGTAMPAALSGVAVEHLPDREALVARVAALADGFIGLPGSLASASMLFSCWVKSGGGAGRKPVVLYNRNHAFEVMRGYAADVLTHGLREHERIMQFSDSIEDLWTRASRMLNMTGAL